MKKMGRPRKNPDKIRVVKGFSFDADNLDFIQNEAKRQQKNASEIINLLLSNIRSIRGE
jgi:hypothetical protein